jgi:predicted phosphodiesterase
MRDRVLILSDLHLGGPESIRYARGLRPLLEPGTTLVLNGDTAEFHRPEFQEDAEVEYRRLLALAEDRDVAVVTLAGNHDPFVSERRTLELADGTILVTHGDAFHPSVAPWSLGGRAMRAEWDRFMATLPPEERPTNAAALAAAREAAISQWRFFGNGDHRTTVWRMMLRPSLGFEVFRAWHGFPRLAAAFGRRHSPAVRVVVAGHSHRAGVRAADGITVLNTGAYAFPGTPHAAILDGRRLSLWPIERYGRGIGATYRLSARGPRWSQELPGSPARSSRDGSVRPSERPASSAAASSAARSMPVAKPDPEAA